MLNFLLIFVFAVKTADSNFLLLLSSLVAKFFFKSAEN